MTSSPKPSMAKCGIHKWQPLLRIRLKWLERPVVYGWECATCHRVKHDLELEHLYINAAWDIYDAIQTMAPEMELVTDEAAPVRKGKSWT